MWTSLKKILKDHQDRGIIIEDGEPRYVILSIDAYNRLVEGAGNEAVEAAVDNTEVQEPPKYPQDIRVEDLPF